MASKNLKLFRKWFSDPLEFFQHKKPLSPQERHDEFDGAFLAMSLGLFLFERYYRIKSSTHDVQPKASKDANEDWDAPFKKWASQDLNIDEDFVTTFWAVFRNGVQHQGMPKRVLRGYKNQMVLHYWDISGDYPALPQVHWLAGTEMVICISPWKFAEFMVQKFEAEPAMLDEGFNHAFGEVRTGASYPCVPVPVL